jgi:NRPS condensation-like uncharacterized protein
LKNHIRSERANLFEPNVYIAMVVKLSGNLTVSQIHKAVFAAYEANEATMSRVVLEADGTAYFEKTETTGCRFISDNSPWETLLQESERRPFALCDGELVRIYLTNQNLLIHAHHLVGDGKSILILLGDIMSALNGQTPTYKPMTSIDRKFLEQRAKLPLLTKLYINSLNRRWNKQAKAFTWDDYHAIHRKYWDENVSEIRLESYDLDKIKEKCPKNVSINSFLVAELVQKYPQCKVVGLPVSIREDNAMSNQVSGIVVNCKYDPQKSTADQVSHIHKSIYKTLGSPLWKYFVLLFMERLCPSLIDAVLLHTHDCYRNPFAAKMANVMGYTGPRSRDLGVTNLGRIDIPAVHKNFTIEDILFVPPKVSYAKQIVGVSTYGNKLTLSYHNMKKRPVAN